MQWLLKMMLWIFLKQRKKLSEMITQVVFETAKKIKSSCCVKMCAEASIIQLSALIQGYLSMYAFCFFFFFEGGSGRQEYV